MDADQKEEKNVYNYQIKGMHCAACVQTIEKSLRKVEGVIIADVNLGTRTAKIEADPEALVPGSIEKAIKNAGYEIEYSSISVQVGGMTCVMCAKKIEDALNKISGIYKAEVNLSLEKVDIQYDQKIVSLERIRDAILELGYEYKGIFDISGIGDGDSIKKKGSFIRRLLGL